MRTAIGTLALIALTTLSALPATAGTVNEDLKLTASDPAADDRFGWSVAISGTTALVGAYTDDDSGSASGSAYLFDTTTGQQLFKLTASDGASGDQFGWSVAISGTTAIIGAFSNDGAATNAGSAYLFDTTTGQQLFKLTASDAASGDNLGRSVAISGTTAIAGAWTDDGVGTNSGSAYLFDTTTGAQLFKLTASDAAAEDRFGYSVAISGTTAVVGAWFDSDAGGASGSAYVFDTTTGQELFKLTAADAAAGDRFGGSVAISGTTAIVGALFNDDAGSGSGSAYVFDTTTGTQLFKLTAIDAAADDSFGISVAISGTTAIIGANLNDDTGFGSGSAYLFDTTTGQQLFKLTASDAAAGDDLGTSVAISGATAIAGAYRDDDTSPDSGSAYLFNLDLPNPCPTDLDNSGVTDLADLNLILANFGMTTAAGDTNNDGIVDLADLNAILAAFGTPCP